MIYGIGGPNGENMLNPTPCWETGRLRDNGGGNAVAVPMRQTSSPRFVRDSAAAAADKSLRLQACWIRLWDRWACEQHNLVVYQMHINHALSRERCKLTLAGGRLVPCGRRVNKHHHHHHHHQQQQHQNHSHYQSSSSSSSTSSTSSTSSSSTDDWSALSIPRTPDASRPETCDLHVLSTAVDRLRASGWYYEGDDAQARTAEALARMPPGRFCVRDSKHPEHLFTMDVRAGGGGRCAGRVISVRFTYADGAFRLDWAPDALRRPQFRCPIELVDYYVWLSRVGARSGDRAAYPVWVDQYGGGEFFTWMNLRRPMVKSDAAGFPSLKHMARLVVNRHRERLVASASPSLPNELTEYLLRYPYSL